MSLTFEELGITEDQWDTLATSLQGAIYAVDLYQWEPEFGAYTGTGGTFADFDAINFDGDVYKVTYDEVTASGTPVSGYVPTTSRVGVPLTMSTDGTTLRIFAITPAGIAMNEYDGSWSNYGSIVTDANVRFIAATANDCVHFITYDSANFRFRLHVATYDGSWSVQDSDIYWGYLINSFAAKRVNGVDALILASDSPGIQSVSVVGTTINKKILPSGGIYTFTYKYGSWSDHFEIDHIDQWSNFRYRNQVRMSVIDDVLWLTAYSSDGTVDNPIVGYRTYTSKDGLHWSRGELLKLDSDTSQRGVVLLADGTALYAEMYGRSYTAERTLQFGTPHEDMMLSLKGKIISLSFSRQDMQQLTVKVDNRRQVFAGTFVDGEHVIAAILKTGFHTVDGDLLIPVGIFEVDTVENLRELPTATIEISARDRMAWLTTKSQSEQFLNWTPQIIGLDEYQDTTGSGYGGMTHTAPAKGSFKAADGALQLSSNNEEGMAYNTNLSDNWNGSVESSIALASLGNEEYIGLVFRSPDQDNGFFYYYDQADDVLKLDVRLAGVATTLWSSSAKSWDDDTDTRWIRVTYRYCKIILYSSTNGQSWTVEQTVIVVGQGDEPLVQSGYVGSFGRGFSDLSESYPDLGLFPEGDLPDNYLPYADDVPEPPHDWCHNFFFGDDDGGFVDFGNGFSNYTAGRWETLHSSGTNYDCQIKRTFSAATVTGLAIYYSTTPGNPGTGTSAMGINATLAGVPVALGEDDDPKSPAVSGNFIKTYHFPPDVVIDRMNCFLNIQSAGVSAGFIGTVRFYGIGTNPFGTDNCV